MKIGPGIMRRIKCAVRKSFVIISIFSAASAATLPLLAAGTGKSANQDQIVMQCGGLAGYNKGQCCTEYANFETVHRHGLDLYKNRDKSFAELRVLASQLIKQNGWGQERKRLNQECLHTKTELPKGQEDVHTWDARTTCGTIDKRAHLLEPDDRKVWVETRHESCRGLPAWTPLICFQATHNEPDVIAARKKICP